MDRKPRKQLPGIMAKRRRMRGSGVTPKCGGFSRVPRTHTVRVRFMYFYCHPLHPWGIKMKRIKRMKLKKGATFLAERYYLSRSLQPPFSGNIHQICYPIGRIIFVTQKSRKSQKFSSRLLSAARAEGTFRDFCEFLCDIYISACQNNLWDLCDKKLP